MPPETLACITPASLGSRAADGKSFCNGGDNSQEGLSSPLDPVSLLKQTPSFLIPHDLVRLKCSKHPSRVLVNAAAMWSPPLIWVPGFLPHPAPPVDWTPRRRNPRRSRSRGLTDKGNQHRYIPRQNTRASPITWLLPIPSSY